MKICSCCGKEWKILDNFLQDRGIIFYGYQANFKRPQNGLFLFQHDADGCKTSLAVKVHLVADYFDIKLDNFTFSSGNSEACLLLCEDHHSSAKCLNKACKGSSIRDIISLIKKCSKK